MDYRYSTGVGKRSINRQITYKDNQTGAVADGSTKDGDAQITVDTQELANQFIIAAVSGVASAAVTRFIFSGE